MISLNALFKKYFLITLLLVLVVVMLTSNIGSRVFFENFMMQARYEQDVVIMDGIRDILYGQYGIAIRLYFLSLLARQHSVDIIIKRDEELLFSTNRQYVLGGQETVYTEYTFEDLSIHIGRVKNILLEEVNAGYIRTLHYMHILTFFLALVITLVFASLLSKKFNKPIMQLSQNINYISMGKYHNIMSPNTKARELKFLSDELNKMAEHKKNEERLRQRLSNDIVHELKTPITALVANLEAINDGIYEADEERINILIEQTNRLAKLVQRLSDLTLIESERDRIEMGRINLSDLLKSLCMVYEPEASEAGISLDSEINNDIFIYGNKDRLIQVYVNLISNAIKYTDAKGRITVRLYENDEYVISEVEDTGIGIDEKDLPYIFERFYRSDESRSRKTGGAGIGLAIVKAIVMTHDGDIRIQSQKDKGTKISILFNKI